MESAYCRSLVAIFTHTSAHIESALSHWLDPTVQKYRGNWLVQPKSIFLLSSKMIMYVGNQYVVLNGRVNQAPVRVQERSKEVFTFA